DPANHYSISATSVLRHVYDPLLDVTNDDKFVPALAETWRPLNNTSWRFTLRKGVTFHDGTPFNADSVVFTLRRVQSNSKLIKSFVYHDIESVEKDGDSDLLEAGHPQGGEGHLPLHPGAVHAHGRPALGRAPGDRPRHPRSRGDAQGHPRRQGARRARHRGPALDLPARQGAGEGPAAAPGHLARHRPRRDHQGAAQGLWASRGQSRAAPAPRPYDA